MYCNGHVVWSTMAQQAHSPSQCDSRAAILWEIRLLQIAGSDDAIWRMRAEESYFSRHGAKRAPRRALPITMWFPELQRRFATVHCDWFELTAPNSALPVVWLAVLLCDWGVVLCDLVVLLCCFFLTHRWHESNDQAATATISILLETAGEFLLRKSWLFRLTKWDDFLLKNVEIVINCRTRSTWLWNGSCIQIRPWVFQKPRRHRLRRRNQTMISLVTPLHQVNNHEFCV